MLYVFNSFLCVLLLLYLLWFIPNYTLANCGCFMCYRLRLRGRKCKKQIRERKGKSLTQDTFQKVHSCTRVLHAGLLLMHLTGETAPLYCAGFRLQSKPPVDSYWELSGSSSVVFREWWPYIAPLDPCCDINLHKNPPQGLLSLTQWHAYETLYIVMLCQCHSDWLFCSHLLWVELPKVSFLFSCRSTLSLTRQMGSASTLQQSTS